MSSREARRQPPDDERIGSPGDSARIAVERLNSALYLRRVSPDSPHVWLDLGLSIGASLIRLWQSQPPAASSSRAPDAGSHEDRQQMIERQQVALANSIRELFARVDRIDEQLGDQ